MIRAAFVAAALPHLVQAGDLSPVPYDSLLGQPHLIETFDSVPRKPEPGITFDNHWRAPGVSIAERLEGQTITERPTRTGRFDALSGAPVAPRVVPGALGQNLTVAYHKGFGSNALFPVGPAGAMHATGRGEGSVALSFDEPQSAVGFRVHAEYDDPLGHRPAPKDATVTFYDRQARLIAQLVLPLRHGVLSFAWRSNTGIAAMTVETTDPGGIAFDDILYAVQPLSG